jgi:hypothetical protein
MVEYVPLLRLASNNTKKKHKNYYPELILLGSAVLSFIFWPGSILTSIDRLVFIIWFAILSLLIGLAYSNLSTGLLPTKLIYALDIFALALQLFAVHSSTKMGNDLASALAGGLFLLALFYGLFIVSKGRWVGGGVVRISFAAGIILGLKLSIFACLLLVITMMLITLIRSRVKKQSKAFIQTGVYWLLVIIVVKLLGS